MVLLVRPSALQEEANLHNRREECSNAPCVEKVGKDRGNFQEIDAWLPRHAHAEGLLEPAINACCYIPFLGTA